MSITFEFIKKLKCKLVILLVGFLCYFIADRFLPFRAVVTPQWYYNIDSVLYYLIYYCLGYLFFLKINQLLTSSTTWQRILVSISFCFALIYATLLFFGRDCLVRFYALPFLGGVGAIIKAMLLIWVTIIVAYLCRDIVLFQNLGKNTLYMCGSEYLVKRIVPVAVQIIGLNINITTPMAVYLYSIFLLIIVNYFFAPLEKKIIARIYNILLLACKRSIACTFS